MRTTACTPSHHFNRDTQENRYYDHKPELERLVGWYRADRSKPALLTSEAYDVAIHQLWRAAGRGISNVIKRQYRRSAHAGWFT